MSKNIHSNENICSNGILIIQMLIGDKQNKIIPKIPFKWNRWHSNDY